VAYPHRGDGTRRMSRQVRVKVSIRGSPWATRLGGPFYASRRLMAKQEIDRARERRRRDLKILAANKEFRGAVHALRRALNVSPEIRRRAERAVRQELGEPHRLDPNVHNAALNSCLFDLLGGGMLKDERQKFNRKLIASQYWELRSSLDEAEWRTLEAASRSLEAALLMDFDGSEFEMWADEARPTRLTPWYDYVVFDDQQGWETHREAPLGGLIKRGHIWLNVTGRDLAWLHEVWPDIERMQGRSKPPPLKRGKPPGVPARRETVLGKTWEEIKAEIRRGVSQVTRYENSYINAKVSRKEEEWLKQNKESYPNVKKAPDSLKAGWRRQAKDNFYHQVIVHPSMRDLNLRPRQKGRPRKN